MMAFSIPSLNTSTPGGFETLKPNSPTHCLGSGASHFDQFPFIITLYIAQRRAVLRPYLCIICVPGLVWQHMI